MTPPPLALPPVRRRGWLRRAIFQVHLWTGLAVGLYAVAISLSGSILVFAPASTRTSSRGGQAAS